MTIIIAYFLMLTLGLIIVLGAFNVIIERDREWIKNHNSYKPTDLEKELKEIKNESDGDTTENKRS